MQTAKCCCGLLFLTLVLVAGAPPVRTQPATPPPPDKYKIAVRYNIQAPRDQHVAQYKDMVQELAKLGFQFEPKLKPWPNTDYEDPGKNILTGFIAHGKALGCLANPSVASLLLMPDNYQLPEDPSQPVRVRLELAGGFPEARQLALANQVRALLGLLDFKESVGYDHRGYTGRPFTRIVGTIPGQNVETLLKDLRTQPSGWFMPQVEMGTLPPPLSQVTPIVVTEVIPEPSPAQDAPPTAKRGQEYLDKISPDLWALVVSKDDDAKIVRAEIILSYVPAPGDESYREALTREAPSLFIEGRLGPVVTGLLRVNQASGLAGLSLVSVVRLARPSLVQVDSAANFPGDNAKALQQSGLQALHSKGFKGKGVRIGIIDSDFHGYKAMIQSGKLPKTTRLLDLTAEYNPDLYPDPEPGEGKALSHGTHCALAAALAAPDADLTLIRIDPASLLQVQLVARIVDGGYILDDHLTQRADELRIAARVLAERSDEVVKERQPILNNFDDDSALKRDYEILGPVVRGWLFTPREWSYRRLVELEQDLESQRQLETRFYRFLDDLKKLKGLDIVCTSLVWNDGYPLGGASALSQLFDQNLDRKAVWFVSAGNTHGQTWTGPFRDQDANGVMEFAAPGTKLSPGTWTPELNFLAWQSHEAGLSVELPEGARLRITMQWQEPHDPSYFWKPQGRDHYLKPLADLSLIVLRQRDASGKTVPGDDFEVAACSSVSAFRIDNRPSGSTYEQIVEFMVSKSGRYALRVQRQMPTRWELRLDTAADRPVLVEQRGLATNGIRPPDAPNLPALESQWELRPRIFVSVTDPANAAKGRVVFRDYSTREGAIPILADTRSLIAVGAASFADAPQPYTAVGTPGTLWNFIKPNVLTYDGLVLTPAGNGSAYGSSLATPFAAGTAAAILSSGKGRTGLEAQFHNLGGPASPIKK